MQLAPYSGRVQWRNYASTVETRFVTKVPQTPIAAPMAVAVSNSVDVPGGNLRRGMYPRSLQLARLAYPTIMASRLTCLSFVMGDGVTPGLPCISAGFRCEPKLFEIPSRIGAEVSDPCICQRCSRHSALSNMSTIDEGILRIGKLLRVVTEETNTPTWWNSLSPVTPERGCMTVIF